MRYVGDDAVSKLEPNHYASAIVILAILALFGGRYLFSEGK